MCRHCNVIKRPDIFHCTDCDVCVEGYDHHCGVFEVCICDANFKFFSMFLGFGGLMCITMAATAYIYTSKAGENDKHASFPLQNLSGLLLIMIGAAIGFTGLGFWYAALTPEISHSE